MRFDRGTRVSHPEWGAGMVEKKLVFSAVRVVFDRMPGLARRVRLAELRFEQVAPKRPEPALAAKKKEPLRARKQAEIGARTEPVRAVPVAHLEPNEAWQTLEALRLGVVPARGIRNYSVGRDGELANLVDILKVGEGCRVVWGDYGAGKTHLLGAAERLALEQNFATVRITLDPREDALHHPLSLYRRIITSMRTLNQVGAGFEPVFERLIESAAHRKSQGARASRFFSPYLHALSCGDDRAVQLLRDYVAGEQVSSDEVNYALDRLGWRGKRVLTMSDYRTYGRMYMHLVGTLACWCKDAGMRGLVLLFDEVERVDALSLTNQGMAVEVLKHYAAVTIREEDLGFDPEALYKGGHAVHRAIPLRFQADQPLITVFALTPLEEIIRVFEGLTQSREYDLYLVPLTGLLLGELVARVVALYVTAYPSYEVSPERRDLIARRVTEEFHAGNDSFRSSVQAIVFQLDADRMKGR